MAPVRDRQALVAGEWIETGDWIDSRALGWTFPEPLEKSLADFLTNLSPGAWESVRDRCMARPREEFTGNEDYLRLAERLREIGLSDQAR